MKKVIVILLCVVGLYACDACCDCSKPKKPKNVSPINCDNYNSVYTTYWNYFDNSTASLSCVLMVSGYVSNYSLEKQYLVLIDDSLAAVKHKNMQEEIIAYWYGDDSAVAISDIINSSDTHSKCFIQTPQIMLKKHKNDCGGYYEASLLITDWGIHFNK